MLYLYKKEHKNPPSLGKPITKVLDYIEKDLKKDHRAGCLEFGVPFILKQEFANNLTLDSLFYPFSQGLHRLLVEIEDGEFVNISQSDVLRYLCDNNLLNRWENTTITSGSMKLQINKEFVKSNLTANVVDVFVNLSRYCSAAAAVVDEKGELVKTLSSSDMRWINPKIMSDLPNLSVQEFLALRSDEAKRNPCVVTENDQFIDMIKKVTRNHIHRFWLVNDDRTPVGMISLSGIFRVIAGYERKTELFEKVEPKVNVEALNRKANVIESSV